jgi:hypothetical protein
MKQLEIISVVTNDKRYWWETAVYLYNLTTLGYKDISILVFIRKGQNILEEWNQLSIKFSDVKFFFYEDIGNIEKIGNAFNYFPVYRFWTLQEHFKKYPELTDKAVFYTDTDIILTKYLDFSPYLKGDINYLSWTGNKERTDNYLWQPYFDGKITQVLPQKLEQFKKLDVLGRLGYITGTSREVITENNLNTGGAQYLLKNVASQFWTDCFNVCCEIKLYLSELNQNFFQGASAIEKENNGYQSFCSDMWTLLYTLWSKGFKTECPKDLDFAWSTDRLSRLEEVYILHNAGVTGEESIKIAFEKSYTDAPLFFKGKYQTYTPFDNIEELNTIINHPISSDFANSVYTQNIIKTHKFLNQ